MPLCRVERSDPPQAKAHGMANITVSILINNYNYAQFLRRSIDSALNQTYGDIEVVVVDDCSTDHSRDVISSYGDRIVAVFQPTNQGQGAAMNAVFAASHGEILMLLDADDYLYPDAAEQVVKQFGEDTAQVQYRMDLVTTDGVYLDRFPPDEVAFEDGDVREQLASSGRFQTTVTSGLAYSRKALDRILPMPAEDFLRGADGYFVSTAPFYGKVRSIERSLSTYCRHGDNHSQFLSKVAERARWRLSHDEARHAALRRHAAASSYPIAERFGFKDAGHLEERLASLALEPDRHPYPGDRRGNLAWHGALAALRMKMATKRKLATAAWFLAIAVTSRPVAARLLTWKLEASLRPDLVNRLARMSGRTSAAQRRAAA